MELKEIAERLSANVEGDGSVEIKGIATLEKATQGDLSFLANTKYYRDAKTTSASAIIVGNDCPPLDRPLLRHENPYLTFAKAIEYPPGTAYLRIKPRTTPWISMRSGVLIKIGLKLGVRGFEPNEVRFPIEFLHGHIVPSISATTIWPFSAVR